MEKKESYRWIETINKTNELAINNERIHITDRESDIYELYRDYSKDNINFVINFRNNFFWNFDYSYFRTKRTLNFHQF